MKMSREALRRPYGLTCTKLNSLTPKSDQHQVSPYSITTESNMNVMRIREMITN